MEVIEKKNKKKKQGKGVLLFWLNKVSYLYGQQQVAFFVLYWQCIHHHLLYHLPLYLPFYHLHGNIRMVMTQLKNLPQLKQKMQVKNNALKGSYHDYCVSLQQQVPWFNTKRLGILESALIFFFFFFYLFLRSNR